jgi:hypothetical protein
MSTRTLVTFGAVLEMLTGAALLGAPETVARLLLNTGLADGGTAVARLAGLALFSLGVACWPAADAPATRALLIYNLLAALYLGYLGGLLGYTGYLLWPAFALHCVLTLLLARCHVSRWLALSAEMRWRERPRYLA